MKCGNIRQLLSAYEDGELDAQRRAGVEHHLGQCEGCAAYLLHLKDLTSLLRVGDCDAGALWARIARSAQIRRRHATWRVWGARISAAAAGFALYLGLHSAVQAIAPSATEESGSREVAGALETAAQTLSRGLPDGGWPALQQRPELLLVQELGRGLDP